MVRLNNFGSIKDRRFIVMGPDYYTTLGVIRSLGEEGIRPIAIIRYSEWTMASRSKYIDKLYIFKDFSEIHDILMQYADEENKPFLIVGSDELVAFMDNQFDDYKQYFIMGNAGRSGAIQENTIKQNLYDAAMRHGFNVAKTWDVVDGRIPEDLTYPVLTKAKYSYLSWKEDSFICRNESELRAALEKVDGRPIFIQQYIIKKNELCLDGACVAHGGDLLVAIASTYTHLLPNSFSNEMVIENFENEELDGKLRKLFADIGYEGIYSVEFLVDEQDVLWFLEINFRPSTWCYAATCLGMNLPLLWADGMLSGSFPEDAVKPIPEGYIALAEIEDYWQRVIRHKMLSTIQWLKKVREADCLFFYSKHDLSPWVHAWSFRIVSKLKKVVRIGRKS